MIEETFTGLKRQAKNLLLYNAKHCGECKHLDFINHPWDGDYAVCKIWHKDEIGVDEKDFTYMNDDVCQYFEKTDEKEMMRRKKVDGSWEFKRE